jgi:hypothetical protein
MQRAAKGCSFPGRKSGTGGHPAALAMRLVPRIVERRGSSFAFVSLKIPPNLFHFSVLREKHRKKSGVGVDGVIFW